MRAPTGGRSLSLVCTFSFVLATGCHDLSAIKPAVGGAAGDGGTDSDVAPGDSGDVAPKPDVVGDRHDDLPPGADAEADARDGGGDAGPPTATLTGVVRNYFSRAQRPVR